MVETRRKKPPIEVHANARLPLGMPAASFLRDYWQKWPLLIRGALPDFNPPLAPDDLAGLACMDDTLARIVVGMRLPLSSFRKPRSDDPEPSDSKKAKALDSRFRGNDDEWTVLTGPFDDATFAKLPTSHWTLLVQDVDKWDTDTAALLDAFAFIPSWRIDDVMVSYAADGGGVGAHVDQYDVFLLQGLGQRRWAIDARPNPPTDFRDDVELKLLKKFSPTHAWTLGPGDILYLPPGVPHDGVALGECMTFSIGMRAPSAAEMLEDFAHAIAGQLPEEQRYLDPDLQVVRDTGEIDDAAIARAARAMPWLRVGTKDNQRKQKRVRKVADCADGVPSSLLRTWFGCFITRYRAVQTPVPRKRPIDRATLAQRLPNSVLERSPWSRFAWCRNGHGATLFVTGTAFDAPLAWARELASGARALDGARLLRLPQAARGLDLLTKLTNAGYVRIRHG